MRQSHDTSPYCILDSFLTTRVTDSRSPRQLCVNKLANDYFDKKYILPFLLQPFHSKYDFNCFAPLRAISKPIHTHTTLVTRSFSRDTFLGYANLSAARNLLVPPSHNVPREFHFGSFNPLSSLKSKMHGQ